MHTFQRRSTIAHYQEIKDSAKSAGSFCTRIFVTYTCETRRQKKVIEASMWNRYVLQPCGRIAAQHGCMLAAEATAPEAAVLLLDEEHEESLQPTTMSPRFRTARRLPCTTLHAHRQTSTARRRRRICTRKWGTRQNHELKNRLCETRPRLRACQTQMQA